MRRHGPSSPGLLTSSALMEDTSYVGKVFDMELERITRLNEMPQASMFYFLDPVYTGEGPEAMLSKIKRDAYGWCPVQDRANHSGRCVDCHRSA